MANSTTKDRILEAAKKLFADKGYHETAMDAIAKEAGVSKGSLYWHFDSKEDLVIKMVKREGKSIINELRDLNIPKRSPSQILRRFIEARLEHIVHNKKANQLFMDNENLRHDVLKEVLCELFVQIISELEKIIQRGIEEGEFRFLSPRETAIAILGAINSIRFEMIISGYNEITEKVDFLMDMVLKGIANKEGSE